MIAEIITSHLVPLPRRFFPGSAYKVMDMVDAAISFLELMCPAMEPLLRAGFSYVPAKRPSALDMLTVLNSEGMLAALEATSATLVAGATVVRTVFQLCGVCNSCNSCNLHSFYWFLFMAQHFCPSSGPHSPPPEVVWRIDWLLVC